MAYRRSDNTGASVELVVKEPNGDAQTITENASDDKYITHTTTIGELRKAMTDEEAEKKETG